MAGLQEGPKEGGQADDREGHQLRLGEVQIRVHRPAAGRGRMIHLPRKPQSYAHNCAEEHTSVMGDQLVILRSVAICSQVEQTPSTKTASSPSD